MIRTQRPLINSNKTYSTYENNGVFQICFKSKGCRYYLNGYCIMCDYGKGENITPEELAYAFDASIKESKFPIRTLLLNSFGSILDTEEISEKCFEILLNKVNESNIQNIIFETHYTTITEDTLAIIQQKLSNKRAAEILLKKCGRRRIVADSAEPKSIVEMRGYGLNMTGAVKGPDSVEYGIKWLQDRAHIYIDKERCPNTYKEFVSYEYETNKQGEFISAYPDKNNHAIDATRYALNDEIRKANVVFLR